jgi:hypothetical protein
MNTAARVSSDKQREENTIAVFWPCPIEVAARQARAGRASAALRARRGGGCETLSRASAAALADTTWRDHMKATGEARAQSFARRLMGKGFRALLVRSFAPGATGATSISYSGTGAPHRRRASH